MWSCKHGYSHQNQVSMSLAGRDMLQRLVLLAAILKFNMAVFTKLDNIINNALDPEHMDLDTKIKSMCASHTEIWTKHDFHWRQFLIQDGRHIQTK
jgi:hypothetical protein